jgi:hypothetical protein
LFKKPGATAELDATMISAILSLLLADVPDLKSHPDVASVKVAVECDAPKLTIIHIRDWHFVDEERFTLDVRDESDTDLSVDEVSTLFAEHRATVETVQKQETRVLRALIKKHEVNQVFHEGFTDAELPDYKKLIDVLRDFKKYLPTGDSGLDRFTRYQYATDLLQIGVPGQLLIDGHITAVVPAEDTTAFEAANPVQSDGQVVFNEKANEAREDAIVKRMMKASETAVIVLGGSHAPRNNVSAGVWLIVPPVKGFLGEFAGTEDSGDLSQSAGRGHGSDRAVLCPVHGRLGRASSDSVEAAAGGARDQPDSERSGCGAAS